MTKREREQVVELLRCAADHVVRASWDAGAALSVASDCLESPYFRFALRCEWAMAATLGIEFPADGPGRIVPLLEAAARVEEGSWPGADQ